MKVKNYKEELEIPEGTTAHMQSKMLTVSKAKHTLKREFKDPRLKMRIESNKIVIEIATFTRKEKMLVGTVVAHLKNMMKGVNDPYVYKLKVCAGHFPMNITLSGKTLAAKNFVGEKVPRILEIKEGVEVKIEGADITVTSADKELAGQTAGAIELLCRRPGFDPRIFQQGIYMTEKAGKFA